MENWKIKYIYMPILETQKTEQVNKVIQLSTKNTISNQKYERKTIQYYKRKENRKIQDIYTVYMSQMAQLVIILLKKQTTHTHTHESCNNFLQ